MTFYFLTPSYFEMYFTVALAKQPHPKPEVAPQDHTGERVQDRTAHRVIPLLIPYLA